MIPVYYDEANNTWKVVDYDNTDNNWYDYDNKKWANIVLVTEAKRNSLTKDSNGRYVKDQVIGDSEADETLAFYVWIPRFKYRVWTKDSMGNYPFHITNYPTTSFATSNTNYYYYYYDSYTNGIEIQWEKGTSTTGDVICVIYNFNSDDTNPVESCTSSKDLSGDTFWYTHPAFGIDDNANGVIDSTDTQLTGFWIGKFEMSSSSPTTSEGGSTSVTLTPRSLPSVISWRYDYISNFWYVAHLMTQSSNIYGLSTTEVNSSLLTNY